MIWRATSSTSSTRSVTWTSPTSVRGLQACEARSWSSTRPRASRRRRSRTRTSRSTAASRSCPRRTRSTCRKPIPTALPPSSATSSASRPSVLRISAKTGDGVPVAGRDGREPAPAETRMLPPGHSSSTPRTTSTEASSRSSASVTPEPREPLRAMAQGTEFDAEELGFMSPARTPVDSLSAGEVGYVITGLKDVSRLRVGDTLTSRRRPAAAPLPGYQDVKPMVFAGIFPTDSDDYPELRDALERPSSTMGRSRTSRRPRRRSFGFAPPGSGSCTWRSSASGSSASSTSTCSSPRRTSPTARRRARARRSRSTTRPRCRASRAGRGGAVRKASVIVPKDYVGAVMELANERRGSFDHLEYLSEGRVLPVRAPARRDRHGLLRPAEVADARLRELRLRPRRLQARRVSRVDILVGGEQVDALSLITRTAYDRPPARRASPRRSRGR